jgi:DNA-binding protein HU-beta
MSRAAFGALYCVPRASARLIREGKLIMAKAAAKKAAPKAAPKVAKAAAPKTAAPKTAAPKAAVKAAPKKAASAAAGAKAATITVKQIAAQLAETHELPKRTAETIIIDMVEIITKNLKKGNRVRIGGLGILQVRKRAARMGRNPATGEAIKIKASKKVAFRALKELKESV